MFPSTFPVKCQNTEAGSSLLFVSILSFLRKEQEFNKLRELATDTPSETRSQAARPRTGAPRWHRPGHGSRGHWASERHPPTASACGRRGPSGQAPPTRHRPTRPHVGLSGVPPIGSEAPSAPPHDAARKISLRHGATGLSSGALAAVQTSLELTGGQLEAAGRTPRTNLRLPLPKTPSLMYL